MIRITSRGSFKKTTSFLSRLQGGDIYRDLDQYGKQGAAVLARATPQETGRTANSWTYEIERSKSGVRITWLNTNTINGFNVAIGLQYGHGTGTGGYIQGRDFINPVIQPEMDRIAEAVWRRVTSA